MLNVGIGFTPDTTKVKKSMLELQQILESLSNKTLNFATSNVELREGARAAQILKDNLVAAYNTKVGHLDLNKFNQSIKNAGYDIGKLSDALVSAGVEGQEAFMKMAATISAAQAPLKKTNNLLTEMWNTMKNTLRWQISSSVLHGFMGALQTSYGFAKDLNESLNNIRIVTGKSTGDMKEFAKYAGEAAHALSQSTLAYSDAALIYYQQGDTEEIVNEKAMVTLKAASITTESTSREMSEYLTGIWNSYQVGADSLELFVDKIAAVGAATATSMEEIAQAMTKVAATANTVGVSYDQLTSIIATVSSATRTSAESVGTAFKTIFARMGDLKLGATDEDGLGLGIVSTEMKKVGIEILDAQNELKDMGIIVEELGDKWQGWNRGTKTAVAQAIAGKRQYTQLIALFDNWDKYKDTMLVSEGAEGTLDSQADIYAESWEAASKRVKSSWESLVQKFLDDDFFIGLLNTTDKLITSFDNLVESLGGFGNVAIGIGAIFTNIFNKQIANSVDRFIANLKVTTGQAKKSIISMQEGMVERLNELSQDESKSFSFRTQAKIMSEVADAENTLYKNANKYSDAQKEEYQNILNTIKGYQDLYQEKLKQGGLESQDFSASLVSQLTEKGGGSQKGFNLKQTDNSKKDRELLGIKDSKISSVAKSIEEIAIKSARVYDIAGKLEVSTNNLDTSWKKFAKSTGTALVPVEEQQARLRESLAVLQDMNVVTEDQADIWKSQIDSEKDLKQVYSEMVDKAVQLSSESKNNDIILESYLGKLGFSREEYDKIVVKAGDIGAKLNSANLMGERVAITAKVIKEQFNKIDVGMVVSQIAGLGSSIAMITNQISSLVAIWEDDEKTTADKITSTITSILFMLPSLIQMGTGISKLNSLLGFTKISAVGATGSIKLLSGAINFMGGPVGIAIAAFTALIAVFVSVAKYSEQVAENQRKLAQAQIDGANAAKEETDANIALSKTYETLLNQYEQAKALSQDTLSIQQSLADAAYKVAEVYNIQGAALAKVTGDYSLFNEEVKKAKENMLQRQLEEDEEALVGAGAKLKASSQQKSYDYNYSGRERVYQISGWGGGEEDVINAIKKAFPEDIAPFLALGQTGVQLKVDESTPEKILETYDRLVLVQKHLQEDYINGNVELEKAGSFKSLEDIIKAMSADAEEYRKFLDSTTQLKIVLGKTDSDFKISSESDIKTLDDMIAYREERTQAFMDTGNYSVEQATLAVDDLIKAYGSTEVQKLDEQFKIFSDIDNILNNMDFKDIQDFYNSLSDDKKELFLSGKVHFNPNDTTEDLQDALDTAEYSIKIKSVQDQVDLSKDMVNKLSSGESLEGEDYTLLTSTFSGLIDLSELSTMTLYQQANILAQIYEYSAYQEMSLIQDQTIRYRQELENIDKIADAQHESFLERERERESLGLSEEEYVKHINEELEIMREKMSNSDYAGTWDTTERAIELAEVKLTITDPNEDIEYIQKQLRELTARTYEIKMELTTNLSNALVAQMESIAQAGRLIGEGFVVAKEDVEEFSNIMPQLLVASQNNADGSIQLDQKMVESTIAAEKEKMYVRYQALDAQLANDELMATYNLEEAEKAIEIATNLATGEAQLASLTAREQKILAAGVTDELSEENKDQYDNKKTALTKEQELEVEKYRLAQGNRDVDQKNEYQAQNASVRNVQMGANAQIEALARVSNALDELNSQYAGLGTENYRKENLLLNAKRVQGFKDVGGAEYQPIGKGDAFEGFNYDEISDALAKAVKEDRENSGKRTQSTQAFIDQLLASLVNNRDSAETDLRDIKNARSKLRAGMYGLQEGVFGHSNNKDGKDNKKTIEELDEILDKYHEINREIQHQSELLDELGKQKDRAYGPEYLKLADEEVAANEKLLELNEQKLTIAEAMVESGAVQVKELGAEIDPETNLITNYSEMVQRFIDDKATALKTFNDSAQSETDKMALDAAKNLYDENMRILGVYEADVDVLNEQLGINEDIKRTLSDLGLDKVNYTLQLRLDLSEAKKSIIEMERSISDGLGNALTDGFKRVDLASQIFDIEESNFSALFKDNQALNEIFNNLTTSDSRKALAESFEANRDAAIASIDTLLEYVEIMNNALPDAIAEAREQFDKYTSTLTHTSSVLGTIGELLKLQGATLKDDTGFSALNKITKEQFDSAKANVNLQKQYNDGIKKELKDAEEALAASVEGSAAYDQLKLQRDVLLQEFQASQEALYSAAKDAMSKAQELYTNAITKSLADMENALTSGKGYDLLQMQYDNYMDESERYLDTVNAMYESTLINSKVQKSYDEALTASSRQKIKALQDEFKQRQDTNKLSQYDIDIMNAKYEMTMKQIALEDAQNNKSSVRLKRDAQGNYSYQYTADQSAVDQAMNDYNQAANDYYNLAKDKTQETTGEIVQLYKEMSDAISEVYNDMGLSDEERDAKILEIKSYYKQKMIDLEAEKNKAIEDLNDAAYESVLGMTNDTIKATEAMKEAYDKELAEMGDVINNFDEIVDDACQNMEDANNDYYNTVSQIAKDLKVELGTSGLAGTIKDLGNATDTAAEQGKKAVAAMMAELDRINTITIAYSEQKKEVMDLIEQLRLLAIASNSSATGQMAEYDSKFDYSKAIAQAAISGGKVIGPGGMEMTREEALAARNAKWQNEGFNGSDLFATEEIRYFLFIVIFILKEVGGNLNDPRIKEWLKKEGQSFDTGGYTGNFNDGRLALLHEKELVLNQSDTANILGVVSLVRSLEPALISLINSILSNNASSMGMLSSNFGAQRVTQSGSSIEQSVKIEAIFPSVQKESEIIAAFNTLVNDAAQFTNPR